MNETDYDIAKVVHMMYKNDYVYVNMEKGANWYEFKNHRWSITPNGIALKTKLSTTVFKEYSALASKLNHKATETDDETKQQEHASKAKKLSEIALRLKRSSTKENVMKQCCELFTVDKTFVEKLDEKMNLIGFDNGVYDLDAGIFRDGTPEDMITMTTGYSYTPVIDEAARSKIMGFFSEVFNKPEMIEYMLTKLAYMLHGNKFLEEVDFYVGSGANGKGVLSGLLKQAFGDYMYCPNISMFTTKKTSSSSANSEVVQAKGARILLATEPSEDDKILTSTLKAMSGGDLIQARALFNDLITFKPQFHIILQMNILLQLSGYDGGTARRIKVNELKNKFVDYPTLPFHRQIDRELKPQFEKEVEYAQQFMLILIEQYRTKVANTRRFNVPAEVDRFTKAYMDENNVCAAFLDEFYEITSDANDIETAEDLFAEFKNSHMYNGKDKKWLGQQMTTNNFKSEKPTGGAYRKKCIYRGLKRRQEEPTGYMFNDDLLDA